MSECSGKDTKGKKRNQKKSKTRRAYRRRVASLWITGTVVASSIAAVYDVGVGDAVTMSDGELLS